MNTTPICPISTQKMDENVARLNGAFTVLILALFIITQNIVLVFALLIDFALRSLELSKYSPLALISKYIVNTLKLKKQVINAGPKIFAARIGLFFNLVIVITSFLNLEIIAIASAAIFAFCAFLEAAFKFCVACKLYPFVYKFTNKTTLLAN